MKYQEGLKETKDFLKTTPEPQMRELCNKAGLTEKAMNGMLSQMMGQMLQGSFQNHPLAGMFQQMMQNKNPQQKIQTLINSAQSRGFNINEKCFTEQDLRRLGLNIPR